MKTKFSVQDILDFDPCSAYTEEKITEMFRSAAESAAWLAARLAARSAIKNNISKVHKKLKEK